MPLNSGPTMLIEVRSGLQKIDGFYNDSFEDEEIFWYINKSQDRFIDDLLNDRFEDTKLRMHYIQKMTKTSPSPVPVTYPSADARVGVATINADVRNLVAVEAKVIISMTDPTLFSNNGMPDINYENTDGFADDIPSLPNPVEYTWNMTIKEFGEANNFDRNQHYRSDPREPYGEVYNGQIRCFRDKRFIIGELTYDYITVPVEINASLDPIVLWDQQALRRIADMTVEHIKTIIEDPNSERVVGVQQLQNQQ